MHLIVPEVHLSLFREALDWPTSSMVDWSVLLHVKMSVFTFLLFLNIEVFVCGTKTQNKSKID